MKFEGEDILSAGQFDRAGLDQLFTLAHRMRPIAQHEVSCHVLNNHIFGSWFFTESTRTRLSGETAFLRLGGHVVTMTDMKMSSEVKGESFADSIQVLASFCDIMVVRCRQVGEAAMAAQISSKPVINGGDGSGEHPTQALLDAFTIQEEFGTIDGLTVAMVGDLKNGRTVHSLARLLLLYPGVKFIFVAPSFLPMPPEILQEIDGKGHSCVEIDSLRDSVKQADVIYMVRPQSERMTAQEQADVSMVLPQFRIDREFVEKRCQPNVRVMHPLPRNSELNRDIDPLPAAAYFRQVDNGILVRMALFLLLLGKENKFV